MVHVHFKEEIGIAELIPLVTTYIILFAYIYFSTRKRRLYLSSSVIVFPVIGRMSLIRFSSFWSIHYLSKVCKIK